MEQIKNLKYFAMMLIMALTSISLTACSDDDDDVSIDSELVGEWVEVSSDSELIHFLFKEDGTGVNWLTWKGNKFDDEEDVNFTWEITSKGTMTLRGKNVDTGKMETYKVKYEIHNGILTIFDFDEGEDIQFKKVK